MCGFCSNIHLFWKLKKKINECVSNKNFYAFPLSFWWYFYSFVRHVYVHVPVKSPDVIWIRKIYIKSFQLWQQSPLSAKKHDKTSKSKSDKICTALFFTEKPGALNTSCDKLVFYKISYILCEYSSEMEVKTNYCDFFEGTEKLLEIWFGRRTENSTVNCDLRSVPRWVLL